MKRVMSLDLKGDTPWMLAYPGVLNLADMDFSPIACPPYGTRTEFIATLTAIYLEIFWGAALQSAAFTPGLEALVQPGRTGSLADLQNEIALRDKTPAGKGAVQRLDNVRLNYPTIFHSTKNLWEQIHEKSIYAGVDGPLTPATKFLFWFLLSERFRYLRAIGHRDKVHTVVVLDESPASLGKRQQTISGQPPIPVQLLPVTREHGIQFVVATPSWVELDQLVLSQFGIQVLLQVSDGRELEAISKTFRFTGAQGKFAGAMPRGTAIGKARGVEQPFVFTYEPFQNKTITPTELAAARERTRNFCNENASIEDRDREPNPPAATPELDQQATLSPVRTPAAPAPPKTSPNTAVLNEKQHTYLAMACELGAPIVTELNDRLGLHPMEADRIRKKIGSQGLGLLHETRITVGGGRGKQATCLTPSETAYNMLGIKKPHLGRGSGPQHAWLLRTLAQRIPATIEVNGADLALVLDHEKHRRFTAALHALGCDTPPNGTALAIEVELAAARTLKQNLDRDHEHTLVIIATPKNELQTARRIAKEYQNAIVVDVFALLDALQSEVPQ